ncbi:hypothetical protein COCON_G00004130 [Conger conger]|uniref:Uncharacterized protein n=1 Tax=Conger conger TaxID=82655 RepID=A0A9Q1E1R6_CONCO|nr:hypothetical protein COCON_G00004130 [Conger conger]
MTSSRENVTESHPLSNLYYATNGEPVTNLDSYHDDDGEPRYYDNAGQAGAPSGLDDSGLDYPRDEAVDEPMYSSPVDEEDYPGNEEEPRGMEEEPEPEPEPNPNPNPNPQTLFPPAGTASCLRPFQTTASGASQHAGAAQLGGFCGLPHSTKWPPDLRFPWLPGSASSCALPRA